MERLLRALATEGFSAGRSRRTWPAGRAPVRGRGGPGADGALLVVAVDRLYGGGGTARFDPGSATCSPRPRRSSTADDAGPWRWPPATR